MTLKSIFFTLIHFLSNLGLIIDSVILSLDQSAVLSEFYLPALFSFCVLPRITHCDVCHFKAVTKTFSWNLSGWTQFFSHHDKCGIVANSLADILFKYWPDSHLWFVWGQEQKLNFSLIVLSELYASQLEKRCGAFSDDLMSVDDTSACDAFICAIFILNQFWTWRFNSAFLTLPTLLEGPSWSINDVLFLYR